MESNLDLVLTPEGINFPTKVNILEADNDPNYTTVQTSSTTLTHETGNDPPTTDLKNFGHPNSTINVSIKRISKSPIKGVYYSEIVNSKSENLTEKEKAFFELVDKKESPEAMRKILECQLNEQKPKEEVNFLEYYMSVVNSLSLDDPLYLPFIEAPINISIDGDTEHTGSDMDNIPGTSQDIACNAKHAGEAIQKSVVNKGGPVFWIVIPPSEFKKVMDLAQTLAPTTMKIVSNNQQLEPPSCILQHENTTPAQQVLPDDNEINCVEQKAKKKKLVQKTWYAIPK